MFAYLSQAESSIDGLVGWLGKLSAARPDVTTANELFVLAAEPGESNDLTASVAGANVYWSSKRGRLEAPGAPSEVTSVLQKLLAQAAAVGPGVIEVGRLGREAARGSAVDLKTLGSLQLAAGALREKLSLARQHVAELYASTSACLGHLSRADLPAPPEPPLRAWLGCSRAPCCSPISPPSRSSSPASR